MKDYCPRCDKEFEGDWQKHDCYIPLVNAMNKIDKRQAEVLAPSVYEKEIWNAAIEAAASVVDQANRDGPYQAIASAKEIRKLKK